MRQGSVKVLFTGSIPVSACICKPDSVSSLPTFEFPASACVSASGESGAEGGEERIANCSRSATPVTGRFKLTHLRVTSN